MKAHVIWFVAFHLLTAVKAQGHETNSKSIMGVEHVWGVKVNPNGRKLAHNSKPTLAGLASRLAAEVGAENLGQVGELRGYYLLKTRSKDYQDVEKRISNHENVMWHKKQLFMKRAKRSMRAPSSEYLHFKDPLYENQWHLENYVGLDCNVTGVWSHNITGTGVVVAVVDDGVEWRHPDLKDNYCKEGSFDLNSNDDDPTPVYDEEEENKHGTRCAGEIAAVPNSVCGIGIAHGAKFSGIRVLDGATTDATEATAFNRHMDVNDVYSCSWGPEDDGVAVDGPHLLGKLALQHGVVAGRSGFGSVFVVASGNGGTNDDNCNYDGYANSIYTVTIGAVDEVGYIPPYAEECTSMLACSLSSGSNGARDVVTTDWSLPPGNAKDQCTHSHTGTSAATPLAAGMVALMLQARPCLSWRDVQHIIVMTAVKIGQPKLWIENEAGFHHSNFHGFGLLNAWRLVNAAKLWKSVPWLTSFTPDQSGDQDHNIPCCGHEPLILKVNISKKSCQRNMISTLEHIVFSVSLVHYSRGKLKFSLSCPSGTRSIIPPRSKDESDSALDWSFTTVKCWGENPSGTYILRILDTSKRLPGNKVAGVLKNWKLVIYGSHWTAEDMKRRRKFVNLAMSGEYLQNSSLDCPPGQQLEFDITSALSDSTIKLITMISCFMVFWSLYYMIEIAFCDVEAKERHVAGAETNNMLQQRNNTAHGENTELISNSTFLGVDNEVPVLTLENARDNGANAGIYNSTNCGSTPEIPR